MSAPGRWFFLMALVLRGTASAQVLPPPIFDFENVARHTPLPIQITDKGLSVTFSGTGGGFSIQTSDSIGVMPSFFSGNFISPNSVFAADLVMDFDPPVQFVSLYFAPQELACDSSATIEILAYYRQALVGTNTSVAPTPGTWPTGILSFSNGQIFDKAVVHYLKPPPTGGDYGVIFVVDNVSAAPVGRPTGPFVSIKDGNVSLVFGGQVGVTYIVMASSNLSLPLSQWEVAGTAHGIVAAGNIESFGYTEPVGKGPRYYVVRPL